MAPRQAHNDNLEFLFKCIESSGAKINFKLVGSALKIKPNAARMRYSRLRATVAFDMGEQLRSRGSVPVPRLQAHRIRPVETTTNHKKRKVLDLETNASSNSDDSDVEQCPIADQPATPLTQCNKRQFQGVQNDSEQAFTLKIPSIDGDEDETSSEFFVSASATNDDSGISSNATSGYRRHKRRKRGLQARTKCLQSIEQNSYLLKSTSSMMPAQTATLTVRKTENEKSPPSLPSRKRSKIQNGATITDEKRCEKEQKGCYRQPIDLSNLKIGQKITGAVLARESSKGSSPYCEPQSDCDPDGRVHPEASTHVLQNAPSLMDRNEIINEHDNDDNNDDNEMEADSPHSLTPNDSVSMVNHNLTNPDTFPKQISGQVHDKARKLAGPSLMQRLSMFWS